MTTRTGSFTAPITVPRAHRIPHRLGFWIAAYAFATAMAFSSVPTPLYGLYAQRDHLMTWQITVVFAAYALGVVISLLTVGHTSDWIGRRMLLIPAVLVSVLAAIVFIIAPSLPGLLIARLLSGFSVGAITATATSYISELHQHSAPRTSRRADIVATAANLVGIGSGPLLAGIIADLAPAPLITPYVVFAVLLLIAAVALTLTPETAPVPVRRPRYRMQRVSVPASSRALYFAVAVVSASAFAIFGLFTSLAPRLVTDLIAHPSGTVTGAVAFVAFAAGAGVPLVLARLSARRLLGTGMAAIVPGLAVLATGVQLSSIAVFIAGGVLTGAGAGMLFKASLMIIGALADPAHRAEALAGIFLAGYIGLAVPILGLGVATAFVPIGLALAGFAAVLAVVVVLGGLRAIARR